MTLVSSSGWSTATATIQQRHMVRLGDGTWIAGFSNTTQNLALARSNDNSGPWASMTQSTAVGVNSFSIAALDGFLFLTCATNGTVYFSLGTVSPDRTTVTWGTFQTVDAGGHGSAPTIAVHRVGAKWMVHCLWSYLDGVAPQHGVQYRRLSVDTATGAVTFETAMVVIRAVVSGNLNPMASIAKHQTNDTLFAVTWNEGAAGAGKGIRAMIGTWNGTTLTWGAEEPVIETVYDYIGNMGPCMIDSQGRVLAVFRDTSANHYLRVFRRPAGGGAWVDISPPTQAGATPTIALDIYDNLFLWYTNSGLFRRDYTSTWGAQVIVDATTTAGYPSARQDTSGGFADVLYMTGASPYSVYSARIPAAGGSSKTRRGYNAPIFGRGRRGIIA